MGWSVVSALTLIAMLVMNVLANSIPIGGNTTGDISDQYPTLFTPAGFTFSIWGVIYLLLVVFVVLLFFFGDVLTAHKTTILILFNAINLLNIAWLLSWHTNRILLSTIVMVALLLCLLLVVSLVSRDDTLAYATFGIYTGWISVATIANIAIWIVQADLSIFMTHQTFWLVLLLGVTLLVGGYMLIQEKNIYYAGVFVWAYIGIAARFL
jgi:tryptophan-rich sensory protein